MKGTISKKNLLKSIDDLPDELSVEQLFDCIRLLQKIEQGQSDVNSHDHLSTADLRKQMGKWLK